MGAPAAWVLFLLGLLAAAGASSATAGAAATATGTSTLTAGSPCPQLPACARVDNATGDAAPCFTRDFEAARACARSIAPRADWHRSTIAALLTGLDNYGFRQLARHSGPPYNVAVDVAAALNATLAQTYAAEIDFHEDVQTALIELHDAHTSYYRKPACLALAAAVSPFIFDIALVDTAPALSGNGKGASLPATSVVRVTLAPSVFFDQYTATFPELAAAMRSALGRTVALIDGLETVTALSAWGDRAVGHANDAGARFNDALRSFLYRPLSTQLWPSNSGIELTLDDAAAGATLTVPWLISYAIGFGDSSACVAPLAVTSEARVNQVSEPVSQKLQNDDIFASTHASFASAPSAFTLSSQSSRRVIVPPGATSGISCFVQTTASSAAEGSSAANERRTLVLVVSSFAYTDFLTSAALCLSAVGPRDTIVIDVQSNGGGIVTAAYALLAMIFPQFAASAASPSPVAAHYLYDHPHGAAVAAISARDQKCVLCGLDPTTLQRPPSGAWLFDPPVAWVQGGVRGMHSKPFLMDTRAVLALIATLSYPPPTVTDRARVTILTDGLCGSACCQFASLARESKAATFVGVGGLWGEPIDVASFCGGYVNNLGQLAAQTRLVNATSVVSVPQFETSASWQWNQAVMYSRAQPSLPMQFVPAPADVRMPFWSFPHASVSANSSNARHSELWDAVIADALVRWSPAPEAPSTPADNAVASGYRTATIALGVALGLASSAAASLACVLVARRKAPESALLSGRRESDSGGDSMAAPLAERPSDSSHYVAMRTESVRA